MKKFTIFTCTMILSVAILAQAPQSFKYQAVARDSGGNLLTNQPVTFRISILQGSAGGASVYAETHPVTTNDFGLAYLNIGTGTPVSGNFTTIVWGANTYYIKVELDPLGGSAYQLMGTSQLLSVPYALYAKNSGDGVGTGTSGQTLRHNGTSWTGNSTLYNNGTNVGIGTTSPSQKLHINGNLRLTGSLYDAGNLPGTSGQLLLSNGTGVQWTNPANISDGDWLINGNDMYAIVTGNVGIGTYGPSTKLSVYGDFSTGNTVEDIMTLSRATTTIPAIGIGAGLIFRNQVSNGGQTLSGRIASVMENVNVASGVSSGMLFQTRNSGGTMNNALYIDSQGRIAINVIAPIKKLDINGDVRIAYSGGGVALAVMASNNNPVVNLTNGYNGSSYGLAAGMTNPSAGSNSYGVFGYNFGFGYGVFGITYEVSGIGTYGINNIANNYGFLGGQYTAVYGEHDGGNFGYLGGDAFGVYGSNIVSQHSGRLGTAFSGVQGYLNNYNVAVGDFAIIGTGVSTSGPNGTGYAKGSTNGSVMGDNYWGNPYTFANAGYSYLDYSRSGGSFGSNYTGTNWGSLAYKNSSGIVYGGYFTTYTQGSGKDNLPKINNGIGVWGDLFGADIHGKVYGAYIEGENYATFANGDTYRTGLDIHLQENGSSASTVLYTAVATDATIQTSGYAIVSNGKATVSFDQHFTSAVSGDHPVIVTVTPMGNSNGIYLSEVNASGFSVVENNNGKSQVTVSYIAIGKRKGFENPKLPHEVITADYTGKLAQGLHNDNVTGTDGAGLYYENGQLHVGKHPSTFPDLNKQPAIIEVPQKPERRIPENIGEGIVPPGRRISETPEN
jgi:hypothetical protein